MLIALPMLKWISLNDLSSWMHFAHHQYHKQKDHLLTTSNVKQKNVKTKCLFLALQIIFISIDCYVSRVSLKHFSNCIPSSLVTELHARVARKHININPWASFFFLFRSFTPRWKCTSICIVWMRTFFRRVFFFLSFFALIPFTVVI